MRTILALLLSAMAVAADQADSVTVLRSTKVIHYPTNLFSVNSNSLNESVSHPTNTFATTNYVQSLGTVSNTVFITIRPDGAVGSGTMTDPFDGSTTNRMTDIFASRTNGYTFKFGNGTYPLTAAGYGGPRFNNVVIEGSGPDTVIQMAPPFGGTVSNFQSVVIDAQNAGGGLNDYFELRDITLDAAWPVGSVTNGYAGGLVAHAKWVMIENVKIYGIGGESSVYLETYGVNVAGHSYGVVRDCTIYATNSDVSGIMFGNDPTSGERGRNLVVANNTIIGGPRNGQSGISFGNADNCKIIHNTFTNLQQGIGYDTGISTNILVQGNTFIGRPATNSYFLIAATGVGAGLKSAFFDNNYIETWANDSVAFALNDTTASGTSLSNIVVSRNEHRVISGNSPVFISAVNTHISAFNNRMTPNVSSVFVGVPLVSSWGNRDFDDTASDNLPDKSPAITVAGTVTTDSLVVTSNANIQNLVVSNSFRFLGAAWDDSQVPAAGIKLGVVGPAWAAFAGGPAFVYHFENNHDDEVHFSLQLGHNYKTGSAVYPHVHWARDAAPGSAALTNVVWELTSTWASYAGVFDTWTTNKITNAVSATNFTHQIGSFGSYSGTGKGISSIFVGRLRRLANSDAADNHDQDVSFLGFDIHYQIDGLGSDNETSKSY